MTVKQLIEELNKYDQDKIVILTEPDLIGWDNIGEVVEDGSTIKKIEFPCDMVINFNKDIPLPQKNGYTLSSKWKWYSVTIPGITLGDNEIIKAIWVPNS